MKSELTMGDTKIRKWTLAALAAALWCAGANPSATLQPTADAAVSVTEHQVAIDGRTLRYTARAGHLPIRDSETGDVHGRMFFIAYTVPSAPNAPPRPVTFLWNGGPGSSSSLVHLLGFGPRRIGANRTPIDNEGTWLSTSDLVFVDPIGTGYSRPVKAEYGPEFYQTRGDAESVAEFIRVYRNQFEAWDQPLFLAGESYGVTRAAGVTDALERRAIHVSGAVLIGLALPLGQLTAEERTAFNVPTYTAAAFVHKKLAGDVQQGDLQTALRKAEAWATDRYVRALAQRDALSDAERDGVSRELARFTGFDASLIDRKKLAIDMPQFSEQLLRDRNLIVGRYDSRLTAPFDPEQQKMYDPTKDPSLRNIIDDVAVVRYLRSEIRFESDLPYQGPFGGGYPPATAFRGDWMSVRWNRPPAPPAGGAAPQGGQPPRPSEEPDQPLRRAMTANPSLKVFASCGYYDLVCSYFANETVANRLEPALRSRVTVRNYGGGHAIYTEDSVRVEIKRDVLGFMQDAARSQARATATPRSPSVPVNGSDEAVTTRHEVSVGGRALRYTARAGFLPIRSNETGEPHGNVFYTAYTLDAPRDSGQRPLTFLWNGGPGANSVLLHLIGFGPRRIKTAHDSASASCECEWQDNEATWLQFSDLVFVDPVGTGYSRPTRAEYGAEFYNTLGDIASIAEFIRVYLTRFDAWDTPLFIAGESYGVWRAAGVAEALEQRGRRVAGVMLISGGVPVGPVIDDELRTALFIPTRTAAAFHHKKLAPDLQADLQTTLRRVEEWARTEYAPALKRVASLTDAERQKIAADLARFTGLDPALIDKQTLIVGRQPFAEQLLRDQGKVLGRFDTRDVEGPPPPDSQRAATVNRYLRDVLQVKTDLAYEGIEEGFWPATTGRRTPSVGARWNYNQGPPPPPGAPPAASPAAAPPRQNLDAPPGGAQPWLRRAIAIDRSLKAFVAFGLYDSLNSCAVNNQLVPALEPPIRQNITAMCYEGGHMMYDEPAIRRQVTKDVSAFVEKTLASRTGREPRD
jgi:carboxypeptidase C (cathepsin A)